MYEKVHGVDQAPFHQSYLRSSVPRSTHSSSFDNTALALWAGCTMSCQKNLKSTPVGFLLHLELICYLDRNLQKSKTNLLPLLSPALAFHLYLVKHIVRSAGNPLSITYIHVTFVLFCSIEGKHISLLEKSPPL